MKPPFSARTAVFSAALCAAAAVVAPPGAARAAPFAPHEATYKVSLTRADSSSGLQNVRGAMQYRFADGCDGWISENAIAVEYLYKTGESVRSTWTFSSWEAKAGDKMRFAVTEKADGKIIDQFAGRAEVDPSGGAGGTAWFKETGGKEETVKLPPGTLLPSHHLRELFNAASGGARVILRTVFDGTSADNPYSVNTVISAGRAAAETAEIDAADAAVRTYPMRFAFFQVRAAGETPDVEMTVHYREDGVAERAVQDFEGYSISLEPEAVRFIKTGGC